MTAGTLKAKLRPLVPARWREKHRRLMMELPVRLRDAMSDLHDRLWPSSESLPIPPARLRWRVGRTSSRQEYLGAGRAAFEDLLEAFHGSRGPHRAYPAWLDFGCGSGRICRHLEEGAECRQLVGVDVDRAAIAWSRKHLRFGEFLAIDPRPPIPLATGWADLIYAASVFTHFDEEQQFSWLAELRRLLKPGGLLLSSTHSETLAPSRPDLSTSEVARLARDGFAFAPGSGRFNANTAFHSRRYLETEWTAYFDLLAFREQGLFRYQDLSVWRARDGAAECG